MPERFSLCPILLSVSCPSLRRTWQDTSGISKEDAEKLFRYSDQTCVLAIQLSSFLQGLTFSSADHICHPLFLLLFSWLPHNSNSYLQDLMERVKRLAMLPDHIAKKMEHLQVGARHSKDVYNHSTDLPLTQPATSPGDTSRLSNTRSMATTSRILIPSPR